MILYKKQNLHISEKREEGGFISWKVGGMDSVHMILCVCCTAYYLLSNNSLGSYIHIAIFKKKFGGNNMNIHHIYTR